MRTKKETMSDPGFKHCHRCGQEKPIMDFSVDAKARDGKFHYCRECKKTMQARSPTARRNYNNGNTGRYFSKRYS